jgi:hypothetical protein
MVVRYGWAYLSGIDNSSFTDWERYDSQSDEILRGNLNLETQFFITAPLFPYLVASFKLIFSDSYVIALESFQITLSSVSVIFLALTANEIFKSKIIGLLTGYALALYPITLYWVHVFGQETIFQATLIIGLYYFTRFMRDRKNKTIFIGSLLLGLALLTKSHIQLAFPFLILSILFTSDKPLLAIQQMAIMVTTIMVITLPYGIYNKIVNDTYVIASTGGGGHFLVGHNDDAFTYIVNPPPRGSAEHQRLANLDYNIFRELKPKLQGLSHSERQSLYFRTGLEWSLSNIEKTIILAAVNFKNFLQPGFHKGHQEPKLWLISFIIALPVFALAYFEILRSVVANWRNHTIIISLLLGMIAFSVIFHSQNRFRVITIEPWYLMYACSGCYFIYLRIKTNFFSRRPNFPRKDLP